MVADDPFLKLPLKSIDDRLKITSATLYGSIPLIACVMYHNFQITRNKVNISISINVNINVNINISMGND
ncbi:MAG: hypothetical protein ACT6FE_03265 [Methanosarcinaceae archaeon]